MNFKKVIKIKNGFLADGMFVPESNFNRHYCFLKEWINENKFLDCYQDLEFMRAKKISSIKREAKNKIATKYPAFKQTNILMSQDTSQINDMNIFIQKIKDQSNLLETQIADMDLDQLNNFDPTSDDNWS